MTKKSGPVFEVVAARADSSANKHNKPLSGSASAVNAAGDELNQKIIQMLEEDGRRPFAELASALDVSEGTIRNRVNSMRQSGHMKIVAMVDLGAVEYKTAAMICIKVAPSATPTDVADRLGELDDIVFVLWVSGRYDLMIEVVSDTPEGLTQFLEDHIHGRSDIAETETMTGLKNFKNQFLLKQKR